MWPGISKGLQRRGRAGKTFVDGVPPPPPRNGKQGAKFDIVERRWLGERDALVLTLGRAQAHFGDEEGF